MRVFKVTISAVLLAAAAPVWAQTAAIKGTVLDPDGKRVASAAVIVRPASGAATTAVTEADGTFVVNDLPPGIYDIEVTATGFAPARKEAQKVLAGKPLELSFTLTVAPFTEEVTVSSKLPEEIRNAPSQGSLSARSPQSVISDAYIRNFTAPASDYAQVLALAPGAYSVASNGPGLGDTKTNFRAFADKQLTINFDGIPFNDTNDPSHHSWVFFPAPFTGGAVFDRSPGTAATIGPATFGGTVGLQSRTLTNRMGITGSISSSSFNTQMYDAQLNSGRLGESGRTSFVIDAHRMTSDGYQTYNSQQRNAFMGKVRFQLNDRVQLTGFSGVIDLNSNTPNQKGPTRAQVEQYGDNFLMSADPASPLYYGYNFYHVPTDFEYGGMRADLGRGWTFDDKVYTYAYHNQQNFNSTTVINATSATDKLNSYRKVGNLLPVTQVSSHGAFRTGLWSEYADTNRYQYPSDPRTWVDAALPNFRQTFITTTLQPYAEYQLAVFDKLSVTPGIKFAWYKQDFRQYPDNGKTAGNLNGAPYLDHNVTYTDWQPSFDVHYLLRNNWSSYAQFSTGSSIPPTNVFDVKNAAVQAVPKPVQTEAYQFGTVYKSRRYTVDFDYYHVRFDNDYTSTTDPTTGEPVYYLAGRSTTQGVEVESNIVMWRGLSAYLNATGGTGKYNSNGLWMAGVPSDTEAIGVNYMTKNWAVGIFNKRVGKTWNDNASVNQASPNDPFNVANLFVNYTLNNGSRFDQTKLQFSVNNLSNSHAVTSFTPGLKTTNLPNPADVLAMLAGRSVSFSVTVGFSQRLVP
jgi:iron complex outermembrane receptor protein